MPHTSLTEKLRSEAQAEAEAKAEAQKKQASKDRLDISVERLRSVCSRSAINAVDGRRDLAKAIAELCEELKTQGYALDKFPTHTESLQWTLELLKAGSLDERPEEAVELMLIETSGFPERFKLELAQNLDNAGWIAYGSTHAQHSDQATIPLPATAEPPEAETSPDCRDTYLGLIVDENRGEVRRKGNRNTVSMDPDSAMWHTFIVAFRAGGCGATKAAWENGYPGEMNASAMRSVKKDVRTKLISLGVTLDNGTGLLLKESEA